MMFIRSCCQSCHSRELKSKSESANLEKSSSALIQQFVRELELIGYSICVD